METTAPRDWRASDSLVVLLLAAAAWLGIPGLVPKGMSGAGVAALVALAFILAAAAGARLRERPLAAVLSGGDVSAATMTWTVVGTAGLTLFLMCASEIVLDLFLRFGLDYRSDLSRLEERVRGFGPVASWALLAGLVPLGEEAVFRGALLRGFRSSWGPAAGLLLSSLLFAGFHVLPPRMLITFVLGLWFGGLALRAGGLAAPVLAHAVNNALVLGFLAAGLETAPPWAGALGSVAAGIAAWRLFGGGSVQGSRSPGPS